MAALSDDIIMSFPAFPRISGLKPFGSLIAYIFSLRTLQHRGQEASGVAIFDGEKINALKVDGLVYEGFRPLILGKAGNDIIISSESAAIDVLGGAIVRDVQPGEVVEIYNGDMEKLAGTAG